MIGTRDPIRVDLMAYPLPLRSAQNLAVAAKSAGFDGIAMTEVARTPYLSLAAMALTANLEYSTAVAVAFASSPMVTAQHAWDLAETTDGHFRLGLGTQVSAHIQRRYSATFEHPGPRLREYVLSLKAIFAAFQGLSELDFEGEYFKFNLLPKEWSPGPLEVDSPPVDIAGVNPWMIRMAGEVADGLHVHPLNTIDYLDSVVAPELRAGTERASRDPGELTVIVPCFAVAGDSDRERQKWRDRARDRVAFYGSTPNYSFLFDRIGYGGTTAALRERFRAGDPAGARRVVKDDILAHFTVEGTWSTIADSIVERYTERAQRVILYGVLGDWPNDPSDLVRWGEVAREIRRLTIPNPA